MKDEYVEIADRSLAAADLCFGGNLHEKACFLAYHAFESIGGAYCASLGLRYPQGHAAKLNAFAAGVNRKPYKHAVGALAIKVASLRNLCLYPELAPDGSVKAPKNIMTDQQARDLAQRVRGVVRRIKSDM